MPITPRDPNNPNVAEVIMQAMKTIMLGYPTPNTNLGALSVAGGTSSDGSDRVFIQRDYLVGQGPWPCVVIKSMPQTFTRNSIRTFDGQAGFTVDYFDRWDQTSELIDDVRDRISLDIERLKANLESNESLAYSGNAYAVGIPKITLSGYDGELSSQFPGLSLVYRRMSVTMMLLPYDV